MKASIFITCLVDQVLPQIGFAVIRLLTGLGVEVSFNPAQTCCGQPAFNSGYWHEARNVGLRTLELLESELESSDYIVIPSGSCAVMLKKMGATLFPEDHALQARAERVGGRIYELSEFLVEVVGVEDVAAGFAGRITYHDSCHLLRELGVAEAPRKLISAVRGGEFVEMEQADVCCGFGGTFSVKYPEISNAIAATKIENIQESGASVVVTCDPGCLLHMAKTLNRLGSGVRCLHLAELLVNNEG
jgi:L-lactate dehydrogenase complex protein LldE